MKIDLDHVLMELAMANPDPEGALIAAAMTAAYKLNMTPLEVATSLVIAFGTDRGEVAWQKARRDLDTMTGTEPEMRF